MHNQIHYLSVSGRGEQKKNGKEREGVKREREERRRHGHPKLRRKRKKD
jgi:hypothetical protein